MGRGEKYLKWGEDAWGCEEKGERAFEEVEPDEGHLEWIRWKGGWFGREEFERTRRKTC